MTLDESAYPIVVFSFTEDITQDDWDRYVRTCYSYMDRDHGIVLIHDHSSGGSPNASQRARGRYGQGSALDQGDCRLCGDHAVFGGSWRGYSVALVGETPHSHEDVCDSARSHRLGQNAH